MPAPQAVAAVLVYRIISFKILSTVVVSVHPLVSRRRRGTTAAARRAGDSGRPAPAVGWGNGVRRMAA